MDDINKLIRAIKKLGYTTGSEAFMNEDDLVNGKFVWREWKIPHNNYKLKNTPFYYKHDKDFIHFTSLDSLYSILNDRHIRLYNLVNMDDRFELEYAKSELMFRANTEKVKEQLYCLSMCASKEILEDENKEHLLWKLHGRNGYGVILRMNFESNLDLWYDYHLTKMFYSSDNFKAIKELHSKTDNEYLDPTLSCFIKLPIYSFENEVRLIFNNQSTIKIEQNNQQVYPLSYPDKLLKADNIFYVQLPLLNFHEVNDKIYRPTDIELFNFYRDDEYPVEIPKIGITEIILGYRYNESDLNNITSKIDFKNLGIKVKITPLKKYF